MQFKDPNRDERGRHMTAVFDLDDTISKHKGRDFKNAVPIIETINSIHKLKTDGWKIVIYSARGQNSCCGDLRLIEQRNRRQIEEWLKKYNVPFDELRFGKPLGDLYIDDKGINLSDFLNAKTEKLNGNSGSEIFRVGKIVYKNCQNAAQQAEWYEKAKKLGVNVPEVYSVVINTISMEYIEAKKAKEINLYQIISTILLFSLKKNGYKFNTQALIDRANEHLESHKGKTQFSKLFAYLQSNEHIYQKEASFCHGDLSLSNIITTNYGNYYIDPIVNENYSSYLLDFAKIRFSLDGGENFLKYESKDYASILHELDEILEERGILKKVKALEAIYWIRLLKYTKTERKNKAVTEAKRLEAEL